MALMRLCNNIHTKRYSFFNTQLIKVDKYDDGDKDYEEEDDNKIIDKY